MTLTDREIHHRRELREHLMERIEASVASPSKRAEYVSNVLTYHELDLLAELAVTFAREQVEARMAALGWRRGEKGAVSTK